MEKKKHSYLNDKNRGCSKQLRGKVLCDIVFVSEPRNEWKAFEKQAFLTTFRSATSYMEKEAAKDGVSLRFSIRQNDFFSKEPIEKEPAWGLRARAISDLYPDGIITHFSRLKETLHVDEVAVYLVFENNFREHALQALSDTVFSEEYCCIRAESKMRTIVHETLHLFGANDYYYPQEVVPIANHCFPDSVMASGLNIDSLTRYLIGWRNTLDIAAQCFLDYTKDISGFQLSTANSLEWGGKEIEYIYNRATPYASFQDLQKRAQEKSGWASFLMGYCCQHGISGPQNTRLAEQYYESSSIADIVIADYARIELLMAKPSLSPDEKKIIRMLLERLENGKKRHPWARSLHAACLFTGTLFPKDLPQALSLTMGHYSPRGYLTKDTEFSKCPIVYQMYRIAEKYSRNIPQLHEAMENLVKRYEIYDACGDPGLNYMMGIFLQEGVHMRQNQVRALELYRNAADAGFSAACSAVARCYLYGIGTAADPAKGRLWKEKALKARQQEEPGMYLATRLLKCPQR